MLDFFNGLYEFVTGSVGLVFNFVIWIINFLIWLICGFINLFVGIFPDSPFDVSKFTFGTEKYFGYLNWLIPIDIILNITFLWCGCMVLYWGYSVIMRWIKLID